MKRLIFQTTAFVILFMATILFLGVTSSRVVSNRGFSNYSSESNLLFLQNNNHYDLVILGISHARNLSRGINHSVVEAALHKSVINLGKGGGVCGFNEQLLYLQYFYSQNNQAQQILFVLSPPLLFSETLPIATNTFDDEPLNFHFSMEYLTCASENKYARFFSYFRSKLTYKWLMKYPEPADTIVKELTFIDPLAIEEGQNSAFGKAGLNHERYHANAIILRKTIDLALKNDAKVVLVIPPALFGKWRGHQETVQLGIEMSQIEGVDFFDFSEAITEPAYYFDHHHLNTSGVKHFTDAFLKNTLLRNQHTQP